MAEFQESFEGKVHNFLISNVEAFNYLTKEDPVPLELFPDSSGQVSGEEWLYTMSIQFPWFLVRPLW